VIHREVNARQQPFDIVDPTVHAIVLSVDEKSQIQALERTPTGLPLKPGRCGTITHDYKRNQRPRCSPVSLHVENYRDFPVGSWHSVDYTSSWACRPGRHHLVAGAADKTLPVLDRWVELIRRVKA
jgi:hypothetical protein